MLIFILGAVIGVTLAISGAGGGVLAIPLLVLGAHLSIQQAAPISLLTVALSAGLGAGIGLGEGLVRYKSALVMSFCGICAAPIGVMLSHQLPSAPLVLGFAVLLFFLALGSVRKKRKRSLSLSTPCKVSDQTHRFIWTLPCFWAFSLIGLLTGFCNGLLGVGGGFIVVPTMQRYTTLDIRSVQATSLAVIALISAVGVTTSIWYGAMNTSIAFYFVAGAVAGLLAGKQIAKVLQTGWLHYAFAAMCVLAAFLMISRVVNWL